MKILLVEDEQRLAATLAKGMRAKGYVVATATNGTTAIPGTFTYTATLAGGSSAAAGGVRGDLMQRAGRMVERRG